MSLVVWFESCFLEQDQEPQSWLQRSFRLFSSMSRLGNFSCSSSCDLAPTGEIFPARVIDVAIEYSERRFEGVSPFDTSTGAMTANAEHWEAE